MSWAPAAAPTSPEPRSWRRIERYGLVVVIGYLVGWRSFAYIGISSLNLFIGEISLGLAFLHPRTRAAFHTAVAIVLRPHRWHALLVTVTLLLGLGFFEVIRGVTDGDNVLVALKNLPFNYYVLLLILGFWLGQRSDRLLERFAWGLATVNALYGVPAVLFLTKLHLNFPGSQNVDGSGPTPVFSVGTGSGMAILALLSFPLPPRWRRWTPALLLANGFVLVAEQQRAEWLGFLVGLFVLSVAKHSLRTFVKTIFVAVAVLAVVGISGVSISGAAGRGGKVSLAGVAGRIIAPVDPHLASRLVGNSTLYAATVNWRTTWWSAIWKSSHQDIPTAVLGHGYGYPLRALTTYVPADTRTPHNVFFYALGYSGWVGVALFFGLWFLIIKKLYLTYRLTGNPFGLAFVSVAFGLGFFGNWFETPYGAAPTYFVVGLALAPLGGLGVERVRSHRRPVSIEGRLAPTGAAIDQRPSIPAIDHLRGSLGGPSIARAHSTVQRSKAVR